MQRFIDPRPRGKIAVAVLIATIVVEAANIVTTLAADGATAGSPAMLAVAAVAMLQLALLVAGAVTVGMWIYRVNANAHGFASGLSITPGWNVGWFFVPVVNLWMPFQGVRETWQASHDPADWPNVPVPASLRLWWGCWLGMNIAGNLSFRLPGGTSGGVLIAIVSSVLSIVAAALLIRIVTALSQAQQRIGVEHVFA